MWSSVRATGSPKRSEAKSMKSEKWIRTKRWRERGKLKEAIKREDWNEACKSKMKLKLLNEVLGEEGK